jgi:hypothetical protein
MEARLLSRIGDSVVTFAKRPARSPLRVSLRGRLVRPALPVVHLVLLGLLAIAGAAWALLRHFTHELPPLTVPIRGSAPAFDADAGELPAPSLEPDTRAR